LQYGGGVGTALAFKLPRKNLGDMTHTRAAKIKNPTAIDIFFFIAFSGSNLSSHSAIVACLAIWVKQELLPPTDRGRKTLALRGVVDRRAEPNRTI
jgi:hypothetical protein